MRSNALSGLVTLLWIPGLAAGGPCPSDCPRPCAQPAECPRTCTRTVECCERVKVCVPVEKVKSRLVKTQCRVPKVHTRCVQEDPCAPPRQVTWTTYHTKTKYHWERYTVTEYKTRYITRCTEQIAMTTACTTCKSKAPTAVLASR